MVLKPVAIILSISRSAMQVCEHLDEAAEGSFAAQHCRPKQPKDSRFNERIAVFRGQPTIWKKAASSGAATAQQRDLA